MSLARYITGEPTGEYGLHLLVDGMHCPSCVAIIEDALMRQSGVTQARLNLSTRCLHVCWQGDAGLAAQWISLIEAMGYRAVPFGTDSSEHFEKREEAFLLRCMAVAGFASGNLMLFSVPLW